MVKAPTEQKVETDVGMRRVGMHSMNGYPVDWHNPHPNSALGQAGLGSQERRRISRARDEWMAESIAYEHSVDLVRRPRGER